MKKALFAFLLLILLYTRFAGLSWGLPYPMHPDERNMTVAIQGLNCDVLTLKSCFNPHFFAYGQLPLYVAYIVSLLWNLFTGRIGQDISFVHAAMSLRLISALASVATVFVLLKIIERFKSLTTRSILLTTLILIFSSYAIQFAHFGTTESLLMLLYSLIVLESIKIVEKENVVLKDLLAVSLFSGLAIATKVSSAIFIGVPLISVMLNWFQHLGRSRNKFGMTVIVGMQYFLLTAIVAAFFSPHTLINFKEFLGSFTYESGVARGVIKVFYTRQFEHTTPIVFQLTKIFPYVLGWPLFILSIMGFFGLDWKDKKANMLRIAFLVYFLPSAFLYAKWARFMAPILPIMTVFAALFLLKCYASVRHEILSLRSRMTFFCLIVLLLISILPGIAYLSIYLRPDVRFTASEWIEKNIPARSYILSETANVVDIPVQIPDRRHETIPDRHVPISFDFYNLDTNPVLQMQLQTHLQKANYIFIPSRRLFKNNLGDYPLLSDYYYKLFTGEYGFKKVAEFHSYPNIELFGKTIIEFPDEDAEETWTVFDHPVIRVCKKVTY